MSDIVERLRTDYGQQWCDSEPNTVIDQYRDDRHDAASEIERLRAENAKLREAVTWRPIESAPRDGTHILVRDVPLGIRITNLTHPPMVVHWFEYIGDVSLSGWYLSHGSGDGPAVTPTHWLPLPEAPR